MRMRGDLSPNSHTWFLYAIKPNFAQCRCAMGIGVKQCFDINVFVFFSSKMSINEAKNVHEIFFVFLVKNVHQ